MSYLGLVRPICNSFLKTIDNPKILEIGIDKGQTMLPMLQNLVSRHEAFIYVGVDILVRDDLLAQLQQFHDVSFVGLDPPAKKNLIIEQENSLKWLADTNFYEDFKFDLVLLDGDHNYETVSQELQLLQRIIKPESIIVCDDFNGRWATKDLFYIEKEEYKNNNLATPKSKSEKEGVGTAIRDFVSQNEDWNYVDINPLEPAILYRSDVWQQPNFFTLNSSNDIRTCQFSMNRLQPKGEDTETHME
jgi:hypothetical protein